MNPLISPTELLALPAATPLVLLDARSGPDARQAYAASHLRGALPIHLDTDLAGPAPNPAEGGRHPLPDLATFAQLLGRLGIGPDAQVVVYDDKAAANAAARCWWLLRAVGHAAVQVLDGGLAAALAAGAPVSSAAEAPTATSPYPVSAWQLPTATADEVARATQSGSHLVVDVREAGRYRGEFEPIDLVAGHIPGAVNVPFSGNLADDGRFLEPELLRRKYRAEFGGYAPEQVIFHCGSGVTACHSLLAIAQAGLPIPALYVGSWSEWSRSGRPVTTGE